jgi:hypothetical protein
MGGEPAMSMKANITVVISNDDAKFLGDLISGKYAWATGAQLTFVGIGNTPPPVDATWLLRANIEIVNQP